jgi:CyaY protein
MTESEFHETVDALLARVERAVEGADALDFDMDGGILTIECPDGSRIIVNRQTPNREIWVAARSGGFHYRWRDGAWRDTRANSEFFAALSEIIATQAGVRVDFT